MISPAVERNLRDIEAASKKLLELAKRMGHTFIITNAMSGWVEYSAAKWVPDSTECHATDLCMNIRGQDCQKMYCN